MKDEVSVPSSQRLRQLLERRMAICEFSLSGKVVLVTGAGRGIGSGIAEVLAQAGADVALNALTPTFAEPTARAINESITSSPANGRGGVHAFYADVTHTEGVESLVRDVLQQFGRIDVLINNLGDAILEPLVALPGTDTRTLDDEHLQRILDINLMATLRCTRAVGPSFLARRMGKVINIASYTVARGGGRVVVYTAAKAAVEGFTRAQALEWAPYNIQVNGIAPGLFPDPRSLPPGEERAKAAEEYIRKVTPLGRSGRLREVGLLALYLASAASDYMTGQTLYLDGGASIR